MIEFVINFIVSVISALSYWGVFILTAMESMALPMPTEILMPLVGSLVASGQFNLLAVSLISALGALFGSLLSYIIGQWLGRKFILKYGKYILLDKQHLLWTEKWFKRKGEKTIFISRFIPIVKHIISIPAGIGQMNIFKFSAYTLLGAGIWNVLLIFLGMALEQQWGLVHNYYIYLEIVAALLIISLIVYFYISRVNGKKPKKKRK